MARKSDVQLVEPVRIEIWLMSDARWYGALYVRGKTVAVVAGKRRLADVMTKLSGAAGRAGEAYLAEPR